MTKTTNLIVQSAVYIAIFILGGVAGVVLFLNSGIYKNKPNEVWVAKEDIRTEDGFSIPKGSELLYIQAFPEGFIGLSLPVNVEGEGLKEFNKEVRASGLNYTPKPTWIWENQNRLSNNE